jgi:hypothetical protein
MKEPRRDGNEILTDPDARSVDPKLPAFLAKPEGAPVYHGFRLLEETRTGDGWCFGAITHFEAAEGVETGDAFVEAPDRSRAGIVWDVGEGEISEILPPEPSRWGVYAVWFREPVHNIEEFKSAMWSVLPELRRMYERARGMAPSNST